MLKGQISHPFLNFSLSKSITIFLGGKCEIERHLVYSLISQMGVVHLILCILWSNQCEILQIKFSFIFFLQLIYRSDNERFTLRIGEVVVLSIINNFMYIAHIYTHT
jgi:hypothetical protein